MLNNRQFQRFELQERLLTIFSGMIFGLILFVAVFGFI